MTDKIMEKPKARQDITVQNMGDEVLLYDSDRESVHILNHTAHAIWNLCDGNHTIEEIQQKMQKQFSEAKESDLLEDILLTVHDLKEKKLIL